MMGVGCIPWSPLCRGYLARPWDAKLTTRGETDIGYKSRGFHKPDDGIRIVNERVQEIAKKRGVSMAQVALAWSLACPFVHSPIVGTTSLKNLEDLIGELLQRPEVLYSKKG